MVSLPVTGLNGEVCIYNHSPNRKSIEAATRSNNQGSLISARNRAQDNSLAGEVTQLLPFCPTIIMAEAPLNAASKVDYYTAYK